MPLDDDLEALTSQECRRLLNGDCVGRLGVVRGGFPLIVPVNYAVLGDRIVVRTDAGTKFWAARQHRVSFEVDRFDRPRRTGWSVLLQGFAVEVTPADGELYEDVMALPVEPWPPGDRAHVLVITPISVTGRRITRQGDGRAVASA